MFAVPLRIREKVNVTKMLVVGSPWQPMPLQAMSGYLDATEEPVFIVPHEMPLCALTPHLPLSKESLELLHIEHFETDHAIATGSRLWQRLVPGSNPPDFLAQTPEGDRGIDCVQFTAEARREAAARSASIRAAFMESDPALFSHLYGLLVYVWVSDSIGFPLPAKNREELIDALCSFRSIPRMASYPLDLFPRMLPIWALHALKQAGSFTPHHLAQRPRSRRSSGGWASS